MLTGSMEEQQCTNGNGETAPHDDARDEDEARLIIDEENLPSEDKDKDCKPERKTRSSKSKFRKEVQEIASAYPCPDCGKTFRRKAKLEAHFLTHKSKDELECENCKRKFRKVDTLFNHVCSGFGNNYKCSECSEWFRLKRDLVVHQQNHKQALSDELPDEKNPSEELEDFSSFVTSFVKWPVTCTQCGVELVNLHHYSAHMATHKKGERSFFCLMCKTNFSSKDDYLLHKSLCHIEGIFECSFCSKKFHTEKRLSDHLESHNGEGVGCDICRLRFVNKEKLSLHMRAHSTSIFVCAKCKKIFRCNSSLKNHTCAPESYEKKLYTFDDSTQKVMNEQFQDSVSTIEDSDSEDAELCEDSSDSHLCKVCGESFQRKEDLISHLTVHFQCVKCKMYFKSQSDLDMHKFLLADEKLYSCCLCEALVHGKQELESHISAHLTTEDDLLDALEWEDNTEILQNINLDPSEPLHSTSFERSLSALKIHKVTPAGKNAIKCSACGKLVFSHHNLSSQIESSTPAGDSDEYVYISRLGSPKIKLKQTEETYCSCHHSLGTVGALSEQSARQSTSLSEYGDQETLKILTASQIPTHLLTMKHKGNEPIDTKSKAVLNQVIKNNSVVLFTSAKKDNTPEASKSEREDCKVLRNSINSTEMMEKSLSGSIASSIADVSSKKDSNNLSDNLKAGMTNVDLEAKKEVFSPQKAGIKVIKLDSSKVNSASLKSNKKELLVSGTSGKDGLLPAPVRIFVTTSGLLSVPTDNEEKIVTEDHADHTNKRSPFVQRKLGLGFRKILPKVNIVSQDLLMSSPKRKEGGFSSQISTSLPPKKIKTEAPVKYLQLNKFADLNKVELITSKANVNVRKMSDCEKVTFESKSLDATNEKNKNAGQQSVSSLGTVTDPGGGNPVRKAKIFDKAEPVLLAKDKSISLSNRITHLKKKDYQGKSRKRRDTSTLNSGGSDSCYLPEMNMMLKVEKPSSDSEENDEDNSLDFSGIKKEFLASDVFIKEEWDIVDF